MIVCACQNLTLDNIVEAMEKYGNDAETLKRVTCAGKGCGECLDETCEEVDLPFPDALKAAEAVLKQF